jgi:hypothetical protein
MQPPEPRSLQECSDCAARIDRSPAFQGREESNTNSQSRSLQERSDCAAKVESDQLNRRYATRNVCNTLPALKGRARLTRSLRDRENGCCIICSKTIIGLNRQITSFTEYYECLKKRTVFFPGLHQIFVQIMHERFKSWVSTETHAGEDNETESALAFALLLSGFRFAGRISVEGSLQASQNYKRHNGISFFCAFCNFVLFLAIPFCSFEHRSKGQIPRTGW